MTRRAGEALTILHDLASETLARGLVGLTFADGHPPVRAPRASRQVVADFGLVRGRRARLAAQTEASGLALAGGRARTRNARGEGAVRAASNRDGGQLRRAHLHHRKEVPPDCHLQLVRPAVHAAEHRRTRARTGADLVLYLAARTIQAKE